MEDKKGDKRIDNVGYTLFKLVSEQKVQVKRYQLIAL